MKKITCIQYIIHKFGTKVTIKEVTKQMHYPSNCKEIIDNAFSKKCRSVNLIFNLVETHNIIQVAKAVRKARVNVYHIIENFAHEQRRDLLKFGQCQYIGEVFAFYVHMRVLNATTTTQLKIKVS